jgi:hypothetical protein
MTPTPVKPLELPGSSIEVACHVGRVGRVNAHRLTKSEYTQTLRDLFTFDVGDPAADFPDDLSGEAAENAGGLTVSDLFFEKSEVATIALAEKAVLKGFISCDPTQVDPNLCAKQIFEPFMARAWRRAVTTEELNAVVAYVDLVAAETGEANPFTQAVKLGLQHVLLSPNFIFRFEVLPNPTEPTAQALSSYDLASRLSYFLYGSMPDEELFAAAAAGTLTDPAELDRQVRRMLADPKSEHMIDALAGDWLWVDRVSQVNPNPALYPSFDADLRASLRQETRLFLKEFLATDRDFADLLDADFTFLNARLAKHYGLPNADTFASSFVKTSLAALPQRGGILTHGGVAAATSAPLNIPTAQVSETNIIVRGKFVFQNLLASPLPAPPTGFDLNKIQADAQMNLPADAPRKVREGVRQTMAPCLNCHRYLDPIGFSMEHFDVTGAWRDDDSLQTAVDSTGVLLDQAGAQVGSFDGARSLGTLLKKDPRFVAGLTKTLFHLVVGRPATTADQCRLEGLTQQAAMEGRRLRELLVSITQDEAFTHQEGESL